MTTIVHIYKPGTKKTLCGLVDIDLNEKRQFALKPHRQHIRGHSHYRCKECMNHPVGQMVELAETEL